MRYILFILFLISFFSVTYPQQHIFSNTKVAEGNPSHECYNILQDNNGYIWFSTDVGLCKYNGKSIDIYDGKKGLPEKTCYGICKSSKGVLWFITSNNRILYYNAKNDRLIEAVFSKRLKRELKNHYTEQFYYIASDKNDNLVICSQWLTFKINVSTNKVIKQDGDSRIYYFNKSNGIVYPIKHKQSNPEISSVQNYRVSVGLINKDTTIYPIQWGIKMFPQWRCITLMNKKGDCFFGWDYKLFKITSKGIVTTYSSKNIILSMYLDKNDNLWIGTLKGGVLHFQTDEIHNPLISLKGLSVTGICEDSEKGVWCSTLERGIYYCRDKRIISYANLYEEDKTENLLKPIDRKVFCYINNTSLFSINSNNVIKYPLKIASSFGVYDLVKYKKGYLLSNLESVFYVNSDFTNQIPILDKVTKYVKGASDISISSDGRVFFLQKAALMELDDVHKSIVVRIPDLKTAALCILSKGNKILLGCRDGLYIIDMKTFSMVKNKNTKGAVNKIIETKTGELYLCIKEKGIYQLNGNELKEIFSNRALKNILFFDISIDSNEHIWVATNRGLLKIRKNNSKDFSLYNTENGLPSNQIHKVAISEDNIFIVTADGLCTFNISEDLINHSAPQIHLSKTYFSAHKKKPDGSLEFPYNYSDFRVSIDALTFKNAQGSKAFYILYTNSSKVYLRDTISTSILTLKNLPPNNYKLVVYAINNNGIKSQRPASLSFIILKPYWQSTWFYLIVIIIFSAIIYFVLKIAVYRIKKKEESKTKINKMVAEYKLTALQAQMNPHFIFNAINSIQGYILNKNEKDAYNYLAKFSKLIRMVLNHSQEKTIVLQQELEMLTLYVELEQLRFDNCFDFNLVVDPTINLFEVYIPTMLLQPYIENAIWHGLMNLAENKKGKLILKIELKNQLLAISIEDNGVGRDYAKGFVNRHNHKSMGMKITEQRIKAINNLSSFENTKVFVKDLYDDHNNAIGTRIEIFIPLI